MMASLNDKALYTGATSDLVSRMPENKNKIYPYGFTSRYHCVKLVYYSNFSTTDGAILEEKR